MFIIGLIIKIISVTEMACSILLALFGIGKKLNIIPATK